eukprot:CFRG5411T1
MVLLTHLRLGSPVALFGRFQKRPILFSQITQSSYMKSQTYSVSSTQVFRSLHSDRKNGYNHSFSNNRSNRISNDKLSPKVTLDEKEKSPVKEKKGVVAMFKKYGATFLVWYELIWMSGFGVIYSCLHFDVFGSGDAIDLLQAVGVDKLISLDNLKAEVGNMMVAAGINELLEPLRLPLAVTTTPWIKSKVLAMRERLK